MQGDRGPPLAPDPHISSFFAQNVELQASQDCPRNFIIYDRTDNRRQIMYNPATPSNLGTSPYFPDVRNDPRDLKEDAADIDALLSFDDDDEDEDECEGDEVSTGRSEVEDTFDLSDSCSSSRLGSSGSERKHENMRKMMRSLRGIVPGGNANRMNTAGVLDEAVKYLKSLKVKAHKIGVGDLSGRIQQP